MTEQRKRPDDRKRPTDTTAEQEPEATPTEFEMGEATTRERPKQFDPTADAEEA